MKTYYRILLPLLAIALLATPLQADTTGVNDGLQWCGYIAFDVNHPMYRDLETHRKVLINTPIDEQIMQRKKFYQQLMAKFIFTYRNSKDFNDERVKETLSALNLYINDLSSKGERPTIWDEDENEKNEFLLPGIEQYVKAEPIRISCSAFEKPDAKSAVLGVAYLSRYVESLSRVGLNNLSAAAAAEAYLASKSYQSWIFKGLAQWPWELKLNEIILPDNFIGDAPDWQFTLLRPNLGFAINPNDYDDADLDYALMLEPVGFIKYLKDDSMTNYDHCWGISTLVSITDSNGTGYGIMARYDNFMLGTCIHDSQDQDWLIYLGVDLCKYLLGEDGKVKQYQAFNDKLLKSK